jgi:hypothetical protein
MCTLINRPDRGRTALARVAARLTLLAALSVLGGCANITINLPPQVTEGAPRVAPPAAGNIPGAAVNAAVVKQIPLKAPPKPRPDPVVSFWDNVLNR